MNPTARPKGTTELKRLSKQGADCLANQHRLGIDLIEIAVVVIILSIAIESILGPKLIGNLIIAPVVAQFTVIPLPDVVHLFCLARRQAAIALLCKARGAISLCAGRIVANGITICDAPVTTIIALVILLATLFIVLALALPLAGLRDDGGTGSKQNRDASRDELIHTLLLKCCRALTAATRA